MARGARVGTASSGSAQAVVDLIDYYLKCLEAERRDAVEVEADKLARLVYPVPTADLGSWQALLGGPVAQRAAGAASASGAVSPTVVLYSPGAIRTSKGKLTPLVGVFCPAAQGGLKHDPTDTALGSRLLSDASEAEWAAMESAVQRAAATSPEALSTALLAILRERGMPAPQPVDGLHALAGMAPGEIALMPAFWLVETGPAYDQGLVLELQALRDQVRRNDWRSTGLGFLAQPPQPVGTSDAAILEALANPAALTLSQATALAGCAGPLTIVTGPPGTGKTRLITAIAVECMAKGQSILVASRINQAVDSAVSLAVRMVGRGGMIRTGSSAMRSEIAEGLSWLAGQSSWPVGGEIVADEAPPRQPTAGRSPAQDPARLDLAPLAKELAALQRLSGRIQGCHPPPYRWYQWRLRHRYAAFQLSWNGLHDRAAELLEGLGPARHASSVALRVRLDDMIRRAKPTLGRVSAAINGDRRARHSALKELAGLGFPIAVTNLSISGNLPLEAGLFDLVVIDEATTCDPASLLPLLFRAKRVVVVGDPQQLPHITSKAALQVGPRPTPAALDGKPFSAAFDVSAYHLCAELAGPAASYTLRDHFRCPPAIISFSNDEFYGGDLRIHTTGADSPARLAPVAGDHERARSGSLVNEEQQAATVLLLAAAARSAGPTETLGLVTPYRAAAEAITRAVDVHAELSELRKARRLVIGTAHTFQGSEVDHLVFMTTAGANADDRVVGWVENRRLFNVAITRARKSLVIVADPALAGRGGLPLTTKLLAAGSVALRPGAQTEAQRRLGERLAMAGIPHLGGSTYRGYPLDLLDASDHPAWGVRFTTWEMILALTPLEALRRSDEDRALQGHGVKVLNLTPLHPEARLDEFAAERELDGAV